MRGLWGSVLIIFRFLLLFFLIFIVGFFGGCAGGKSFDLETRFLSRDFVLKGIQIICQK